MERVSPNKASDTNLKKGVGLLGFGGFFAAFALLGYATTRKVSSVLTATKRGKALVVHHTRRVPWTPKGGAPSSRVEVVDSPAELAVAGSEKLGRKDVISLNAWTLATLIASEVGSAPNVAKVAVAHAAMNAARAIGKNVFRLIAPDGHYGGQQGRYASSARPPTKEDVAIAEAVYTGKIKDPTGGAVQWDSPRAQTALLERREPGYKSSPKQVAASRMKAGKVAVYLPGVDPEYLRLWRPSRAA